MKEVALNIVASFIWLIIGFFVVSYRKYISDRNLRLLLGTSSIDNDKILVVYPTFLSNTPKGTKDRFKSTIPGEEYLMEGPDELVAANDLMGIKYVLEWNKSRLSKIQFEPHSSYPNPSRWPEKSIIAIGGPAVNVICYRSLVKQQQLDIHFKNNSGTWQAFLKDQSEPLYSLDRRELDYGFVCRIPHHIYQRHSIVMLFGLGSQGTEAACFFAMTHTKKAAKLLAKNKFIVLKVVNNEPTRPVILFPQ